MADAVQTDAPAVVAEGVVADQPMTIDALETDDAEIVSLDDDPEPVAVNRRGILTP